MDLQAAQIRREWQSVGDARSRLAESGAGGAIGTLSESIEAERAHIRKGLYGAKQQSESSTTGDIPGVGLPLLSLDGTTLATITLATILDLSLTCETWEGPGFIALAFEIGRRCYWERRRVRGSVDLPLPNLRELIQQRHPTQSAKWVNKHIQEFEAQPPDHQCWLALGGFLLECAEEKEIISIEKRYVPVEGYYWELVTPPSEGAPTPLEQSEKQPRQKKRPMKRVFLDRSVVTVEPRIANRSTIDASCLPVCGPLIFQPKDWTSLTGGGFLAPTGRTPRQLIQHHNQPRRLERLQQAADTPDQLQLVFDAVNALQRTRWRLNQPVYTLLRRAAEQEWDAQGLLIPGLPSKTRLELLQQQVSSFDDYRRQMFTAQSRFDSDRERIRKPKDVVEHLAEIAEQDGRCTASACPICARLDELANRKRELQSHWEIYHEVRRQCGRELDERNELRAEIAHMAMILAACKQLEAEAGRLGKNLYDLDLWFAYQLDYRGRAYALSAPLNPQGDDAARALLRFSAGQPLGNLGRRWLAIHLANMAGYDKRPLNDRVTWTIDHSSSIDEIAAIMASPETVNEERLKAVLSPDSLAGALWRDAAEPWQFLAACLEWSASDHGDKSDFVSFLPVSLDATANGLQHLSAIGRDDAGAKATNLSPDDRRHDIYQEVADETIELLRCAPKKHQAMAQMWIGHVDRSLVKEIVLATPYGVGRRGIRSILRTSFREKRLAGEFSQMEWKEYRTALNFLAGRVEHATEQTVTSAVSIKGWLQLVATLLAEDNLPVEWTSPIGLPITVEDYVQEKSTGHVRWKRSRDDKDREFHTRRIGKENDPSDPDQAPTDGEEPTKPRMLDLDQQRRSITAGFVHALDAAHMMLTVGTLAAKGFSSFGAIHDSFAIHAGHVDILGDAFRCSFIEIHASTDGRDPLRRLLDELKAEYPEWYARHADELEPLPPQGTFDIQLVKQSTYVLS